jgi:Family of unknown function (DUF5317)
MIIVAVALIGVVMVACTGVDLRRLVDLPIRHLWLVWTALGVQVGVLSLLGPYIGGTVGNAVHMATYAVAATFVIVNRHVPGVMIMGLGGALNLTAIVANGGVMPASSAAWHIAGLDDKAGFANSVPIADPHLLPLGDVLAIPAGWPLANVFSVGDLLLVMGLMWMVHRWCRRPVADATVTTGRPRNTLRPS